MHVKHENVFTKYTWNINWNIIHREVGVVVSMGGIVDGDIQQIDMKVLHCV